MSIENEYAHNRYMEIDDDFLLNDSSQYIPFENVEDSCATFIAKLEGIEFLLKQSFLDLPKIAGAYHFAYNAHEGQNRKSGEPYIMHPVSVAIILAKLKQDTSTVCAALLHDVIEDTQYTYNNISELFGKDVADIVEGVTKVSGAEKVALKEHYEANTYRKMILSTSKNPRTIIVKLADRLHNLSTLGALKPERQKSIAEETLAIYAPLASEMGIHALKVKLEDMSMKYAHPDEYEKICQKTTVEFKDNQRIIEEFKQKVEAILTANSIEGFKAYGRVKSVYSIYRKHTDREVPYEEIYDILGFRVVCREVLDCYKVMGLLHSIWVPIGDKIKDYIALPKENGYKSLHTTLMSGEQHLEVQIRTWDMNLQAEYGFAAHNVYKGDESQNKFLQNFERWEREFSDGAEFLDLLKDGIAASKITVYVRKGENKSIELPDGATVLDLAYHLGADKGNKCSGAFIEGKFAPIDRKLLNNQTVDILTSTDSKPNIDWLTIVKTPTAKLAIKKRIQQLEADGKANRAFSLLISAHQYISKPVSFEEYIEEILKHFGVSKEKELFDKIYAGDVTTDDILKFTRKQTKEGDTAKLSHWVIGKKRQNELLIDTLRNTEAVRPAACCNPLPGDKIVGFATNGDRGISIHRENCDNAFIFADDPDRVIYCDWAENGDFESFSEEITILGIDKETLFPDVIRVFRDMEVKSDGFNLSKGKGIVKLLIWAKVKTAGELNILMKELEKIKGITSVGRNLSAKKMM